MKVRFLSSAEKELAIAVRYYSGIQPELAERFLMEVETVVRLIELHPLAWTPLSTRTRRCRMKHFPFGLFYRVRPDEILIVAVMDLRRDPQRWEHLL